MIPATVLADISGVGSPCLRIKANLLAIWFVMLHHIRERVGYSDMHDRISAETFAFESVRRILWDSCFTAVHTWEAFALFLGVLLLYCC